jgi:hypothetical protein
MTYPDLLRQGELKLATGCDSQSYTTDATRRLSTRRAGARAIGQAVPTVWTDTLWTCHVALPACFDHPIIYPG